MPVDRYGLTPKQRLFCEIYSRERNATQAAIEAGYSKSSAGSIGSENLQKPEIIKYLDLKMQEAIEKVGVTKDWRLEMLRKGIEISMSEEIDDKGRKHYRNLDLKGVKGLINEINKMAGDHAATTSNLNVSETKLDAAEKIADEAEKEINDIKTF